MHTILIADDCPTRRWRLDVALRELGYFTILTDTAHEALGVLRSVQVDLLLAQERLSDVEASALAAIARRRGLDELVIVLLAEDAAAARRALGDDLVDAVLPHDAETRTVLRVVRRLLRPVVIRTPPSAGSESACALAHA